MMILETSNHGKHVRNFDQRKAQKEKKKPEEKQKSVKQLEK